MKLSKKKTKKEEEGDVYLERNVIVLGINLCFLE